MNIVHLSAEKTWRGGEKQIAYLIECLRKSNQNQLVICRKNSAFEKYCIENQIPYTSLSFKNQFDLNTSLSVKKICKEFKADVVHMHSSHAHAIAVWSYYLGNTTPMVLSRKVDFAISNNILSKIKYNCKGIKKIICVSEEIKKIMESAIIDKSKLEVIYDGIDTEKYFHIDKEYLRKEFNIDANTPIIANTSALADHKDYPTFINMIKYLKNKIRAKYFIISEGPLFEEVRELVKLNRLEEDVIFTGFRKDIDKILPSLDYFVITSKTEGLGSSILDAYAAEVPVICTNAGGIKEIANQDLAMVNKVGDYVGLANSIIELINNTDLKKSKIEKAKSYVKNFDKEIMSNKTLSLYQQISSSK